MSPEMQFLISILFSKKINKQNFKNVNFDKLIFLASSQLVLPLFYKKLINNKIKSSIKKKFIKYLKEIYLINSNRNRELIKEIAYISKILKQNKINHVFIKGAALAISKLSKQIGIRMIGDIDILVKKNDFDRTVKILKKNKYQNNKFFYNFFDTHHYPRLTRKNKLFAVEIHNNISNKNKILKVEKIIDDCLVINKINVPKFINQKIIAIWNFQDGDDGLSKCNYSLRNYYDVFGILKNEQVPIQIKNKNLFIKYFTVASHFGLIQKTKFKYSKITLIRFKLKNKFKFYRSADNIFIDVCKKLNFRVHQLFKVLKDKKYRTYLTDTSRSL